MNRLIASLLLVVSLIAVLVLGGLGLKDGGLRAELVPFVTAACILVGVSGVVVRLTRPESRSPEGMTATATWRVAVTVSVFFIGLPVVFVVQASSSWSMKAVLPLFSSLPHGGRSLGTLEDLLLLGVPFLVVAVPESMHAHSRSASSLVTGWLAGFASVLTAAFILTLHFGGIAEVQMRTAQMGALSVAAFGLAVLLAPFYRFVASECAQQGIAMVFDPARWCSSGLAAFGEVIRAPTAAPEPPADGTGASVASRTRTQPETQRDVSARMPTAVDVAKALAATDPDRAAQLLTDAQRSARSITDKAHKASALSRIARALAVTDPDRAAQLLTNAERIARSITYEPSKASTLSRIAEALAVTDPDRAAQLFSNAQRIAYSVTDTRLQVSALVDVGEVLAVTDPDRAAQLLTDAERIACSIINESGKASALSRIAEALAAIDPNRAERIARSITDEYRQALALSGIAKALSATSS
jgi:hypothetical protein